MALELGVPGDYNFCTLVHAEAAPERFKSVKLDRGDRHFFTIGASGARIECHRALTAQVFRGTICSACGWPNASSHGGRIQKDMESSKMNPTFFFTAAGQKESKIAFHAASRAPKARILFDSWASAEENEVPASALSVPFKHNIRSLVTMRLPKTRSLHTCNGSEAPYSLFFPVIYSDDCVFL
jgi:hypothetical protein